MTAKREPRGVTVGIWPESIFYSDADLALVFGNNPESIAGALLHRAQAAEAIVDNLPKTDDGQLFDAYAPAPGCEAWCVWRYDHEDGWRVSKYHAPLDGDETLEVDDMEDDECELLGVYSSREAAEAAQTKLEESDG